MERGQPNLSIDVFYVCTVFVSMLVKTLCMASESVKHFKFFAQAFRLEVIHPFYERGELIQYL